MEAARLRGVLDHIEESWPKVRRVFEPNPQRGTLPLPFPYTVPSIADAFQEMYYWDTYFTNLGLLRSGRVEWAKSNTDNYLWMVDRYGYAPNGNLAGLLHRSQPPYLSQMVREVYEATGDKSWLRGALGTLEAEYAFWMRKRSTPTGLNRHFHDDSDAGARAFCVEIFTGRLHLPVPSHPYERKLAGDHYYAEAETGWDFTPRFDGRCGDFLPVDLNSSLYQVERNLAHFRRELELPGDLAFDEAAEKRRSLMAELLWNEQQGNFLDYDFRRAQHSKVASAASLHPLYTGAATAMQARRTRDAIGRLETEFGIAVCEENESGVVFQWDYPNGWPPIQGYAMMGMRNAGFVEDAKRLATKYIRLCVENFERTGRLWEKYNVATGGTDAQDEYPMPPMIGWTAGVFLLAVEIAGG